MASTPELGSYARTTSGTCRAGNANSNYDAPVAYETQWVYVHTDDGQNWLEVATGHKCTGATSYRFRFWVGSLGNHAPQELVHRLNLGQHHHDLLTVAAMID